jgi:hypothetical protein
VIELSKDQTVEQILLSGYYEVPRFQRPYSWSLDNVGDFWTDTMQNTDSEYFIGAFIVYKMGDDTGRSTTNYAVVDGQQRLTTITVLLAALRDSFAEDGEQELAQGVQRFIQREDRRNQPRLILETEGGFPFFQARVQSFPKQETGPEPQRPDERLLAACFDYFLLQIRELRSSFLQDSTIAAQDRVSKFVEELEHIRDKILNLSVIFVVVENEDDAYIIFETLNTRGKDLSLADLVRNFILKDLRETAETVDLPRNRFNQILATLQQPDVDIAPSEFILHSWLSRHDYTSGKNLFREMKSVIRSKQQKEALLAEYEQDLPIYIRIRRPNRTDWGRNQADVADSLKALVTFDVKQPIPLILSTIRAFEDNRKVSTATLRRVLRALESFHFRYTAVAGKSSSGGVSQRYAMHARKIAVEDKAGALKSVNELIGKLRESLPSRDEFVAGFAELKYSSVETRRKPLVRYVLEKFCIDVAGKHVSLDLTTMTIEHLAPESPSPGRADAPTRFSSIGNLILVTEALNNELGNKSFTQKSRILISSKAIGIDPAILVEKSWTDDKIDVRTNTMAMRANDHIWRI